MKTLVIIPAYNEEENIGQVIGEIKNEFPQMDILVVDDGSQDTTTQVAENTQNAVVLTLVCNLGVGGAIQTGFKYAKQVNCDMVIRVDGDGQHPASQIKHIIDPLIRGQADVVIGSRFLTGELHPDFLKRIGQWIISRLILLMTGERITDVTSGFRSYNKRAIDLFQWYYPSDFPEPEEIIFLRKNHLAFKEVKVAMRERIRGNSSLTATASMYYMVKVILSICMSFLRAPVMKRK